MEIKLHMGDLPSHLKFGTSVAVDTETLGLNPHRDRLCLVQLTFGDGIVHLVKFNNYEYDAPNLTRLFSDESITKLFHFARFDLAVIQKYLNVIPFPIYCTKIASKLTRTYTDRHGLKNLISELLGIDISKQQQSSDWAAQILTYAQQEYAATDVIHLHELKIKLDKMLDREGRWELAKECFKFLPARAMLDLNGWGDDDIFSHK